MNHATVKLGDYTCPLIGIPVSATEDECDLCWDIFHISDLTITGTQFLCKKCNHEPKVPLLPAAKREQL